MKKNLTKMILCVSTYFSPGLKFTLCLLIMAAAQLSVSAQNRTISGKIVSPAGEPLAGVTVTVKNSDRKTITGADGSFNLSVAENAVLQITHVGYKMQELAVSGRSDFQVTLATAENTMNDVVVVGYTSQRRSSITSAVSSVNMADLEQRRVPDVSQLLQGQVAGVQVTQSTGAPGDAINITIRGVGTFAGNSPLYIIDGTPSTDISFLSPADIQSMSVLKDAAGASI